MYQVNVNGYKTTVSSFTNAQKVVRNTLFNASKAIAGVTIESLRAIHRSPKAAIRAFAERNNIASKLAVM